MFSVYSYTSLFWFAMVDFLCMGVSQLKQNCKLLTALFFCFSMLSIFYMFEKGWNSESINFKFQHFKFQELAVYFGFILQCLWYNNFRNWEYISEWFMNFILSKLLQVYSQGLHEFTQVWQPIKCIQVKHNFYMIKEADQQNENLIKSLTHSL